MDVRRFPGRPGVRRRDSHGVVALEFALVLSMLAMLLLGVVTTGYSYTHAIGVTNSVREGARFGATADASLPSPADWTNDVIARVRGTQFDDPTNDTAICVQLWKVGSGQVKGGCHQGNGSVQPALSLPTTATDYPQVPAGTTAGTCLVRVLAARNFSITLVVAPSLDQTLRRGSVARYERETC